MIATAINPLIATDKQRKYINVLREQRSMAVETEAELHSKLDAEDLAKDEASRMIGWLKKQPYRQASKPAARPVVTAPTPRIGMRKPLPTNQTIGALMDGEGTYESIQNGCMADEPVKPTARPDITEGYYLMDGEIYKVQPSKTTKGRIYASVLTETLDTDKNGVRKWKFQYSTGAIYKLAASGDRLTLDAAKNFSALTGTCAICGRHLTDKDSVERGIGPVCIKKVQANLI
jgi:hypothetical protein